MSFVMDCAADKGLVAEHLKAIAEWKRAVRQRGAKDNETHAAIAWRKVLDAERAIFEHRQKHGCHADADGSFTDDTIIGNFHLTISGRNTAAQEVWGPGQTVSD